MPVNYDFSDVKFWMIDGTPFEIGNFTDITTEPEPGVEVGFTYASTPKEYTVTVTMNNAVAFKRQMMRLAYGWKARGPIRKRVIQRLWKQYGLMGEAR